MDKFLALNYLFVGIFVFFTSAAKKTNQIEKFKLNGLLGSESNH